MAEQPRVCGYVLAGGRSTRMGRDKALIMMEGEPLITRQLRRLTEAGVQAAIAGGTPNLAAYGRLLEDVMPGSGPLSGIVTGLRDHCSTWNLFLAVDVPFVPVEALRRLIAASIQSDGVAVMARVNGQVQPLCAVYATAALPALEAELAAGRWKVTAAAALAGRVDYVDFAEEAWFLNLNTPAELDKLRL